MSDNMPRISVTLSPNRDQISIRLGRKHYLFTKRDNKPIEEIYKAALNYMSDPSKDNLNMLEGYIAPNKVLHDKLGSLSYIEKKTDGYYVVGTKHPIPVSMGKTLVRFHEEGIPVNSILNFWYNCLINPDPRSRDQFWDYCAKHGVTITSNGYAVLYKAVVTKDSMTQLPEHTGNYIGPTAEFIAQEYTNVKRRKRNVNKYTIMQASEDLKVGRSKVVSGDYFVTENPESYDNAKALGILGDFHDRIDDISKAQGPQFTDGWTKTFDIRLGIPVKQDRKLCNSNPRESCSYGLHVGSYGYVSNYGLEATLACFVNPKDVVAIPTSDTSKIRVCQYLPYGIMERDDKGHWTELETSYWEDDYLDYEIKELQEAIENMSKSEKEDKRSVIEVRLLSAKKEAHNEDTEYQSEPRNPLMLPEHIE